MHLAITGANGMIGQKLVARLRAEPSIGDRRVEHLSVFDVVPPEVPAISGADLDIVSASLDVTDDDAVARLVDQRPDVIIHLAAIVSGEAEADTDKGYRINLDGTRAVLDTIRGAVAHDHADGRIYRPRVVFASSIAVFGAPFPEVIDDDFHLTPLSSYGTQKAIGELLLADYTRKGFIDGVGIRLPTIVVRPGTPNLAASGFFSNIIRKPLAGQPAVLPVARSVRHWIASPRSAVGFCLHAAAVDGDRVGPRRNLTMPGLSVSVDEMLSSLERIAGTEARALVTEVPDESIDAIVSTWPERFDASRALELGFCSETDFDEIIRVHIADELDGVNPSEPR